ncbi:hypothetical protein K2224_15440 [Streptomyces sp. BHT-5-2]|nr:hypothetical protein K2224_15440 [Streptomyces sp. BHT-5-2]
MGPRAGLLPVDSAVELYVFSEGARFGPEFCPEAGDDVDLLTDAMTFFFILDDFFDTPSGQPADEAVAAALEMADLLGNLRHVLRGGAPVIVVAFADLWKRMCKGQSATWRQHTHHVRIPVHRALRRIGVGVHRLAPHGRHELVVHLARQ